MFYEAVAAIFEGVESYKRDIHQTFGMNFIEAMCLAIIDVDGAFKVFMWIFKYCF